MEVFVIKKAGNDLAVQKKMTNKGKSIDPLHEESLGHITEVGQQAVWSLSSCKPGKNYRIILPRL